MSINDESAATRLLWTGGWASTFQLLRVLLQQRRPVVPYYLVDSGRPSTQVELATMERIRARLALLHPGTRALLAGTRICQVADLAPDAEVDAAFRRELQGAFIGSQYAWLARFCRQHSIDDLQLCIHRDDQAHAVIEPLVIRVAGVDGTCTWRMDPNFRATDPDPCLLFDRFSLPLFETSKLDMSRAAEEQGWTALMHMTWFCHRPGRDQQPCGRCNPCLYTIEEGLGWRIPAGRRATSAVYRTFVRPFKAPAKALLQKLQPRAG
ncbi:7-cyano-7-deazaguanine synthase [Cognatiluteimonas telluris]|jgi:hypothetical protein|uniref:7-cyano-7-deazaguanine synthase n=1 Tax=Cognatiluteimonas telluris TaxID=1104775 RepID=UPI001407CA88|nr:7-cyano-7-deazaguanine synthase [Lysobacter telluris]